MNITPENTIEHSQLETDATEYLTAAGFVVAEAPYHATMAEEDVEALQQTVTPTALYIRSRADRIAIRQSPPLVFEWEAKTHTTNKRHDCTLEALPVAIHLLKAQLDIRCLYVYRDPYKGYEVGFWIHDFPEVRVIMIPDRWGDAWTAWFQGVFSNFFPGVKIVDRIKTRGSGDPFLIIDESIIRELPGWTDLIDRIK